MNAMDRNNAIPPSRQREKPGQVLKWIGQSMKRVEDPRLMTGNGRYIDDIDLPNMLHAAALRSPYAHARIVSISTARRRRRPGVRRCDGSSPSRRQRPAALLRQSAGRTALCRSR